MIRCQLCKAAREPCAQCFREQFISHGVNFHLYGDYPKFQNDHMLASIKYAKAYYDYQPPQNLSKEPGDMKSLVLNDQMQVQTAKQHAWPKAESPHPYSSFDDPKDAQAFASFLAAKYRDQSFHVFQAVGTAKTEAPPVKWIKASPTPKRTQTKPAV